MKSLYRKLMLFILESRFYNWLMANVVWRLRLSNYYAKMTGVQYQQGYRILQPGMFVLTVDNSKLVTAIIPGLWSHAAYCVGKADGSHMEGSLPKTEMLEMAHEGFNKCQFFDICKESDRVAIFDCLDWDYDYKAKMIKAAWDFDGATYDNGFSLGVQALYCSELIYQADCTAGALEGRQEFRAGKYVGSCRMDVSLADLAGIGRPYISPDGLAKAPNVKCIWDSAGELTGLTGDEIRKKLTK